MICFLFAQVTISEVTAERAVVTARRNIISRYAVGNANPAVKMVDPEEADEAAVDERLRKVLLTVIMAIVNIDWI